jgi:hypothetical protein
MTFQDMKNLLLFRTRSYGVKWGSDDLTSASNVLNPYNMGMFLNLGYTELLSSTKDFTPVALKCQFLSTASAMSIPLNPLPPAVAPLTPLVNPSALQVYEFTYTYQGGGQERYIPISGTDRWRRIAGGYVRRVGNFSTLPQAVSQLFGQRTLQMVPGTAVAGDTISVTVCPDPISSGISCPVSNGGPMVTDTDVPLVQPQFHMAIVEYAVMQAAQGTNRDNDYQRSLNAWNGYIAGMRDYGSTYGEGDSEMHVYDPLEVYDDVLGPLPFA